MVTVTENGRTPLLRVENLTKHFPIRTGIFRKSERFLHAVDGLTFEIAEGEVFGLVGESGCGKTTTGKLLVRSEEPTGGSIQLRGEEVASLEGDALKSFRRRVQMIFQDPYGSLNPRMTLFDIVAEPLVVHRVGSLTEREQRVAEMLERVGLTPASSFMYRYPHELSGGQRQRVAIARALVLEPEFIVADEPTSMLDVSIRAGIMHLMNRLRESFRVSYLYITHDLAVARYLCDRIAVMYLGKIVEVGPCEEVIRNPVHPYTRALISAVPIPDPAVRRDPVEILGGVSKPIDPPPRCRFYDRCPLRTKTCEEADHPPLLETAPGHYVACYEV